MTLRTCRHLFRRPLNHDVPTAIAAFWSEINHPVRHLDHVEIVFDDQQRIPRRAQLEENFQQLRHVMEMQTRRRFIQNVAKLLEVLFKLRASGNTLLIIEHNLDVIKTADWVIDLGPEGGDGGGNIVIQGTPEQVAACAESFTGKYLKSVLNAAPNKT